MAFGLLENSAEILREYGDSEQLDSAQEGHRSLYTSPTWNNPKGIAEQSPVETGHQRPHAIEPGRNGHQQAEDHEQPQRNDGKRQHSTHEQTKRAPNGIGGLTNK